MNAPDFLFDGPPDGPRVALAHGAGGPMDSPFLADFARGLGAAGFRVARFEFPYMAARRQGAERPPDRLPVLLEAWHAAIDALGGPAGLVIGGKSLGGRIASLVAAEGVGVRGLVCLGYPFHPPGQPDKLRVEHLAGLPTPTLIVQGERDALGSRDEVARYALSPAIRLHWLGDGDHSFKPRVASGRTEEGNRAEGVAAVVAFLRRLDG